MENNYQIEKYNSSYSKSIYDLWNSEVGFIFKLDENIFNQKVNESKFLFIDGSYVVKVGEEVIAFIISKIYDGNEIIQKYINKGWVSLLYVKRSYRRNGIGNNLLDKVENKMREKGITSISIGSDMDNFFPGIPSDFDNLTDCFFKKRGYTVSYSTHDLVKKIVNDDYNFIYAKTIYKDNIEYDVEIRYADSDDKDKLLSFIKNNFYGRWYYECLEYFNDNEIEKEYLMICANDEICGFLRVNRQLIRKISYNITWKNNFKKLVGLGPIGVNADFRHFGFARSLIKYALSEAYCKGFSHALIDWTGLVDFYQQFGFQVWKCYAYAQKSLSDK